MQSKEIRRSRGGGFARFQNGDNEYELLVGLADHLGHELVWEFTIDLKLARDQFV